MGVTLDLCGRCKKRTPYARGLCSACYQWARKRDLHWDYERKLRPRDEVLEDYQLLSSEGYTRRQIAERLGMSDRSLYRALHRAQKEAS